MRSAGRSLTLPPGLAHSSLSQTSTEPKPLATFLRRTSGQRQIETQHQRRRNTQRGEAIKPLRERAHQWRRLRRPQDLQRMRIECDHRGDSVQRARPFDDRAQDFLVSEVHPVEVSDGHYGAARRI